MNQIFIHPVHFLEYVQVQHGSVLRLAAAVTSTNTRLAQVTGTVSSRGMSKLAAEFIGKIQNHPPVRRGGGRTRAVVRITGERGAREATGGVLVEDGAPR